MVRGLLWKSAGGYTAHGSTPSWVDKAVMISIKKLIERNAEELLTAALDSYRAVLRAVGESGGQACPPLGSQL